MSKGRERIDNAAWEMNIGASPRVALNLKNLEFERNTDNSSYRYL